MAELEVLSQANHVKSRAKIRVMQFGEGNFLRAFMDWMIQKLNQTGKWSGHVVVVQPLKEGRIADLAKQDGLYTVILQGLNEKKEAVKTHEVIDVLDDFVNPYTDFERFLAYGESADLQVIISNTTEAGIAFDPADATSNMNECPASYPGKLYALLKRRYEKLGMKGEIAIMPCELIDDNGDVLKSVLLKIAEERNEEAGFVRFLSSACHFTSSLVDRIVPGFPRDEFPDLCQQYGYIDNNMVKGEYFNLLVYRQEKFCQQVFPLDQIGEPVHCLYVPDVHPYKQRKVRILNGSHSSLVPVAYLCGFDEVRQALLDPEIGKFMKAEISEEIVPTVHVKDVEKFASDVLDRFMNPYVHHQLMSIALNSIPKFKERDLPTILDDEKANGCEPAHLSYALASLLKFYDGKRIKDGKEEIIKLQDNPDFLAFMRQAWDAYYQEKDVGALVRKSLSNTAFWGADLCAEHPGLTAQVSEDLSFLLAHPNPYEALKDFNAHEQ
jgi:tagaturonate reductase